MSLWLDWFMARSGNEKTLRRWRVDIPLGCLSAAFAFAIHLARVGRLAWVSTQLEMHSNCINRRTRRQRSCDLPQYRRANSKS